MKTRSSNRGTAWVLFLCLGLAGVPTLNILGLATAAQAQTTPETVRQAYTLLSRGLVDQAIATFRRALQQNPQSVEAQLGLAIAYRRAGRDADALQAYEQVLQLDPNNRLALSTIGLFGEFRQEWQNQGISALTTLIALDPGNAEARAQRAKLLFYQGRFGEAIADYSVALQSSPTPDTLLNAAQVYTYSGNFQQGLDLFNRYQTTGQRLTGDVAIAYALALRETGNPGQAVQVLEAQLRQSNRLNATTIQVRAALAAAYAENQQFAQAIAVLAPLRGRQDSRLTLARTLSVLGRYDTNSAAEAAALYRQVLTETTNPSVNFVREVADVLSSVPSERAYALQLYQQLYQQQPNDRSLLVQQLVLANQVGALSRADLRQQLQNALPTLPADPFQLQVIAQTLVNLDPPDPNVLPLYQSLVSAGVNQPFLNFRIAQMLIQRNDLNGARAALAAYAATPAGSRDQATTLLLLAEIDRREGNLEASAQRYQTIISSNIANLGALNGALQGLAGIRQSQGRVGEAIALYDQLIARNPQDLAKQLGRASLAYQAGVISAADATAILSRWLQSHPLTETPPELFSLIGALPPDPQRESLYTALLDVDPGNVPVQLRYLQVLAARDPAQAEAQIAQLVARDRTNLGAYFVQGQLAQQLGNLSLASQAYETILSQQPSNPDALSALGGVRFQQRQFASAAQLYNQVLSINPQNQAARSSLIDLTAAQGRRIEALQQLEQLELQQMATGTADTGLSQQRQRIQEGFLQQRGFQPSWERY